MDTERDGEGGSDGAKVTRSSFERVTLEARKRDDAEVMDDVCLFVCFLGYTRGRQLRLLFCFNSFFSMFNLCFLLLPCVVG